MILNSLKIYGLRRKYRSLRWLLMAEFDESKDKTLQVGAAERECVQRFREQTDQRRFTKATVLKIMIDWWTSLDLEEQRQLYHGEKSVSGTGKDWLRDRVMTILQELGMLPGNKGNPAEPEGLTELIEKVKHFVRYKVLNSEEQREIESLRKALSIDIKKQRKTAG